MRPKNLREIYLDRDRDATPQHSKAMVWAYPKLEEKAVDEELFDTAEGELSEDDLLFAAKALHLLLMRRHARAKRISSKPSEDTDVSPKGYI